MPDYNPDTSAFKKWTPVKAWFAKKPVVVQASSMPIVAACDQVNRQVNKGFIYQRDGVNNIWFNPDQFVKGQGGDCEDFCIYKMYKLAQAGVTLSRMEIVMCLDKKSREYHMVLRVFSGTAQYILDNQSLTLWGKDSFNVRYAPVYAIGTLGWRICAN